MAIYFNFISCYFYLIVIEIILILSDKKRINNSIKNNILI